MEIVATCDCCGSALTGERVAGMAELAHAMRSAGSLPTSPRQALLRWRLLSSDVLFLLFEAAYFCRASGCRQAERVKGHYPTEDYFPARVFWRGAAAVFGNLFLYYLPYRGAGRKLLEVGCGTGADLAWAKRHGWDVHGLELSESAVEYARKQGLTDVRCSTFEKADLKEDYFDCIAMSQVLEHLYSPSAALKRCHRLLREKGLLLISVPKFDSWTRHAMGNFWHNLQFSGPTCTISIKPCLSG